MSLLENPVKLACLAEYKISVASTQGWPTQINKLSKKIFLQAQIFYYRNNLTIDVWKVEDKKLNELQKKHQ